MSSTLNLSKVQEKPPRESLRSRAPLNISLHFSLCNCSHPYSHPNQKKLGPCRSSFKCLASEYSSWSTAWFNPSVTVSHWKGLFNEIDSAKSGKNLCISIGHLLSFIYQKEMPLWAFSTVRNCVENAFRSVAAGTITPRLSYPYGAMNFHCRVGN